MPKSKTNKDRKQKVNNYKQKHKIKKMSTPEIKPFHQIPSWNSSEKFELDAVDLQTLYEFFNIFAPAFTSIQKVFSKGIQSGQIKMNYQYEDGSPVGDEELKAYTQKLSEYFQNQTKTSQDSEPEQAKIISFD